MSSPLEKSAQMENRYASLGEDPWGNRERQLYQKIFKKATELAYQHLPEFKDVDADGKVRINLYDIGAGGGNVIDVWRENLPDNMSLNICGCDISETAISFLEKRYVDSKFDLVDLEEYDNTKSSLLNMAAADIVSIVDVMYYFDVKRDYKETLDHIWSTLRPGAIVVVADNLVRHFRRDYFKKKEDCMVLEEFTDFTEKICEETSESGRKWNRYLKIRIFKKI